MGNSIYLGGGIKSAFCGGNVKEIWQGANKLFPSGGDKLVIDGLEYRFAKMPDGRIWMCENLQAEQGSAVFYKNDEATYGRNGKNYGRLYSITGALNIGNSVEGWHLPTKAEWDALFNSIGGSSLSIRQKLSSPSYYGGTDDYNFSVLPAGYVLVGGSFDGVENYAYFWTSTKDRPNIYKYARFTTFSGADTLGTSDYMKLSVRLIKDA